MGILRRFWNRLRGRTPPESPDLYWLIGSGWIAPAVHVAACLDIAERLREGPASVGDLARQCGASAGPLLQVLRALAGFGIFEQDAEGRFRLNAGSEPLLRGHPSSVHPYAMVWGQLAPATSRMVEQVRTGAVAFELHHGLPLWDFYETDAAAAAVFDDFMSGVTRSHSHAITAAYDFASCERIVDVGAQDGRLLCAVLPEAPAARGVWFDRPERLPLARARLDDEGLATRCELVAGSFLDGVPSDGDLYLLKHVLHDWPDAAAVRLLSNIARAMRPGATLLIIEGLLDPGNLTDGYAKLRDLEQMAWTGGRVRTRDEFEALLRPAALEIRDVVQTPVIDVRLIEVVALVPDG